MNVKAMMVAAAAAALCACGGVQSRLRRGQVQDTIDQSPASRGYIEAIGIGASDPALATVTQRRALARDAAIVKAQYEMISMLKGVALEGGVTVDRAMETDSKLVARVNEMVRGAEVVKSEFTSDNGCVVTLRLPKSRAEKLMGVTFK